MNSQTKKKKTLLNSHLPVRGPSTHLQLRLGNLTTLLQIQGCEAVPNGLEQLRPQVHFCSSVTFWFPPLSLFFFPLLLTRGPWVTGRHPHCVAAVRQAWALPDCWQRHLLDVYSHQQGGSVLLFTTCSAPAFQWWKKFSDLLAYKYNIMKIPYYRLESFNQNCRTQNLPFTLYIYIITAEIFS